VTIEPTVHHHRYTAFGDDTFGRFAERTARFFGTPQYIVGQTIVVALWIALNSVAFFHHWDARPFILLNLIFSTQAAYAAPLILLAQTREADRDKILSEKAEARHSRIEHAMDRETKDVLALLKMNTELTQQDKDLTEQVARLTQEIHTLLAQRQAS